MSILNIFSIKDDDDNSVFDKIMFILFILPRSILFPLEDVINKILLSDDFLLPHSLMFDRGLIEFVLSLIISLILFLTGTLNINYNKNIPLIILIKIINMIIYSVKAFCLMKIIYIYTSQYVSFLVVSESVAGTVNFIITKLYKKEIHFFNTVLFKIFIEILSLIIVLFGTLMYNEIIVINKWGLYEKTKKYLLLKGEEDLIISSIEADNDDEDNNDEKIKDKNKNTNNEIDLNQINNKK